MDEGLANPPGIPNPEIIPRTHDIHLDMTGAPPAMNKGGGHELVGLAIGGTEGVGDAAVVRVGNVGQGISTPRSTGGDPRSPSANLVDGFFVGSEVGREFAQHHRAHQGHKDTTHNVLSLLDAVRSNGAYSKASFQRFGASKKRVGVDA